MTEANELERTKEFAIFEKLVKNDHAYRKTGKIYQTTLDIFNLPEEEGISTHSAAMRLAEKRTEAIGRIKRGI